jgi:aspartate/glutamate/glutamine transport system ATP-binding protein
MIELRGVNKYFGNLHVLKEINLKIPDGEKLVIIGPSGSGKSTLIRSMNLLEKPTKGKVIINGIDITAPKAPITKIRQSVAMVFQQFNLYPHKTVLENVTLAPILVKKFLKNKLRNQVWFILKG